MTAAALRPMTVGDILDQSFTIYRQSFVTLVGIVAIIHVPLLVLQLIGGLLFGTQLTDLFGARGATPALTTTQTAAILIGAALFVVAAIATGIASIFQTGALAVVVSERFLGNTITVRDAYARALRRWPSLLAMILILGAFNLAFFAVFFVPFFLLIFAGVLGSAAGGSGAGAAAGAMLSLFVCIVCLAYPLLLVGYYAVNTRLTFATQTIVLEHLGGVDGLRRSWNLVRGSFWRVLGINFVLGLLVGLIAQGPSFAISIGANLLPWPMVGFVLNIAAQSIIQILILPIEFAALTLLYYDLRIRKEGFDLQLLAQQLAPTPPPSEGVA